MVEVTYFEEFEVGDIFKTKTRTITEADLMNFCGIAGGFHEYHVSKEFAKKTKYGKRLIHGTLILSIGIGLTTRIGHIEGTNTTLYGIDQFRITHPTFIGDTIHVKQEVIELEPKEEGGVVTFKDEVYNQNDVMVATWHYSIHHERKD